METCEKTENFSSGQRSVVVSVCTSGLFAANRRSAASILSKSKMCEYFSIAAAGTGLCMTINFTPVRRARAANSSYTYSIHDRSRIRR